MIMMAYMNRESPQLHEALELSLDNDDRSVVGSRDRHGIAMDLGLLWGRASCLPFRVPAVIHGASRSQGTYQSASERGHF